MSDEGPDIGAANDAASDSGETEDTGGRTAVVTKSSTRPQRPTGKRSRVKAVDTDVSERSSFYLDQFNLDGENIEGIRALGRRTTTEGTSVELLWMQVMHAYLAIISEAVA